MGAIDTGGVSNRLLGLLDFDTEGIFGRFGDRALAHFLLSFRPGGFFNRLLGANDTGRVFAPGNSLGDLLGDSLGSWTRSTPGEFSLRATRKAPGRDRYRGIFRKAPRRDRFKQGEGLPSKGRNPSFSAGFVACARDAQTESYFFELWQQVFV